MQRGTKRYTRPGRDVGFWDVIAHSRGRAGECDRSAEGFIHRHRVSRTRRTRMGVRVEVRDGESIEQAVKRFDQLVRRYGSPGTDRNPPRWHKRPHDHYLKPSQLARRVKLRQAWITFYGECARRGLEAMRYRRAKWKWQAVLDSRGKELKVRLGDYPIIAVFPDPLIPTPWEEWYE